MSLSPSHVFAVGSRPASARPWIKRAGAWLLLATATAGFAAQAHDAPASIATTSAVSARALPAPTSHASRLVDNQFLIRSSSSQLSWSTVSGAVDGNALIGQWERQGLRPDQGMELLSLLAFTQSPTLARTEQAQRFAEKSSRATQSILDISTPAQADVFLSRRSPEKLARQGDVVPSITWNRPDSDTVSWSDVRQYWRQLGIQTGGTPENYPASSPQDVAAALVDLAAATDEAGLAAFQIPLPAVGRAGLLHKMAANVRDANRSLSQLTGLAGPVLGLNGRISFMPFTPIDNAFAYQISPGVLRMESRWEDVPHEWIHALDFSLRSTPGAPELGGASLSHQVWSDRQNSHSHKDVLSKQWGDLYEALDPSHQASELVSQWRTQRQNYIGTNQELAIYLESPSEIVGYAWGSYVQSLQSQGQVFFDPRQKERLAYTLGPSLPQASTLSSEWKEAFAAVNQTWWSAQLSPSPLAPRNLAQAAAQWNANVLATPTPAASALHR